MQCPSGKAECSSPYLARYRNTAGPCRIRKAEEEVIHASQTRLKRSVLLIAQYPESPVFCFLFLFGEIHRMGGFGRDLVGVPRRRLSTTYHVASSLAVSPLELGIAVVASALGGQARRLVEVLGQGRLDSLRHGGGGQSSVAARWGEEQWSLILAGTVGRGGVQLRKLGEIRGVNWLLSEKAAGKGAGEGQWQVRRGVSSYDEPTSL